jgi:UDP-N-acetylglucosamine 3-dehydrogenase
VTSAAKRPLRAAVVGAGNMGRNHVRVLSELAGADLVAVSDPAEDNLAIALRGRRGVQGYTDAVAMLEEQEPEFVIIATPTRWHASIATEALGRGIHCLVEKPIADRRDEAEAMVKLAEAHDVHLGIGHIERYNPAIRQLKDRLIRGEGGGVHLLACRRTGPFPDRIRDVGVVTDLATHDVDIMMMLTNSSVTRVYAETAKRIHQTHEDLFTGTLRFEDGQIGLLDINWLTPFKTRELTVVCERGTFIANYLTQELTFYENGHASTQHWDRLASFTGVTEGPVTRYPVQRYEPLRAELEAFMEAVRGKGFNYVPGENGLATLEVTTGLLASAESGQAVDLAEHLPSH